MTHFIIRALRPMDIFRCEFPKNGTNNRPLIARSLSRHYGVTDEGTILACPARSLPCDDFRIRARWERRYVVVIKPNQGDFARANDVRPIISRVVARTLAG